MTAKKNPVTTKVPGVDPVPVKVTVAKDSVLIFKASKKMTTASFNAAAKMLRAEQEVVGVKIILQPNSAELKK